MTLPNEAVRISRLKRWILIMTLIPAAAAGFMGHGKVAGGLAAGGLIMVLNLLGTQYTTSRLLEGQGIERIVAVIVWFGKFGITAAVILGLLYLGTVDPIALLVGLGSLPVSLVFDIFLFPVNKGEAKKP
jgi:hypothetical protein